jgi:hypothetical protein
LWWRRLILWTRLLIWWLRRHLLILLWWLCLLVLRRWRGRALLVLLLRRSRGLIARRRLLRLRILLREQRSSAQQHAEPERRNRFAVPNSVSLGIHEICLRPVPCIFDAQLRNWLPGDCCSVGTFTPAVSDEVLPGRSCTRDYTTLDWRKSFGFSSTGADSLTGPAGA